MLRIHFSIARGDFQTKTTITLLYIHIFYAYDIDLLSQQRVLCACVRLRERIHIMYKLSRMFFKYLLYLLPKSDSQNLSPPAVGTRTCFETTLLYYPTSTIMCRYTTIRLSAYPRKSISRHIKPRPLRDRDRKGEKYRSRKFSPTKKDRIYPFIYSPTPFVQGVTTGFCTEPISPVR